MNISDFHDCANCGACESVCPVNAIFDDPDGGLFYRPAVDMELCIDCGKCREVCPVNRDLSKISPICAFSAIHKDRTVVAASSSGGVFSALADQVISSGGVVFGAVYSADCRKVIFASSDDTNLDSLRRSKYTESVTGDVFPKIARQLELGRRVLFCGAPCQVAGLLSYLDKDCPNLLTCDFICGGFASHRLYQDYLDSLEQRYHSKVVSVNFRPKTYGWREYTIEIGFENGKKYLKQASLDPYFSAFLHRQYSIRDYCVKCKFSESHPADIVLADFWRTVQITGKEDDDTGISLVIGQTPKGKEAIETLDCQMCLSGIPLEKAVYNFKSRMPSAEYIRNRELFLSEAQRDGVISAGKNKCTVKGITAVKAHVRGLLRKNKRKRDIIS